MAAPGHRVLNRLDHPAQPEAAGPCHPRSAVTAIGGLIGGPGAYLALASLALPLALGMALQCLAPRGSREPLQISPVPLQPRRACDPAVRADAGQRGDDRADRRSLPRHSVRPGVDRRGPAGGPGGWRRPPRVAGHGADLAGPRQWSRPGRRGRSARGCQSVE